MSKVPPGNILLIEDIDSAFVGREQKAGTKISFAALLNCLDGIVSQDGRIVIMSTNHVDALDPALVRPGRADMRILLNNATVTQAAEMYKRFFADATEAQANSFGIENDGQSMAKIQEQLLRLYSEDETVEQTKENSSSLQTV
jgi:chaperone BCS1